MTESTDVKEIEPDLEAIEVFEETDDEKMANTLLDLVCDEPPHVIVMAKALIAMKNVMTATFEAVGVDPANPLAAAIQEIAGSCGIVRVRALTDDDIASGEFEGFAAGDPIMQTTDEFDEAVNDTIIVLGLNDEQECESDDHAS